MMSMPFLPENRNRVRVHRHFLSIHWQVPSFHWCPPCSAGSSRCTARHPGGIVGLGLAQWASLDVIFLFHVSEPRHGVSVILYVRCATSGR